MFRLLLRWALTLLALGLGLLAVLVLLLRLAVDQVDSVRPELVSFLSSSFNADVEVDELSGLWRGNQLSLALEGLRFTGRRNDDPLLEVGQADLRMDTWQSFKAWLPVSDDARLHDVTLHLYQREDGSWHWPEPATLPSWLQPDRRFDLDRLDAALETLLRQRVDAEEVRLVLHGRESQVVLEAPQLLIDGDRRHTRISGWINVEGKEGAALQASLELMPGRQGLADFNAAMKATMDVSSLVGLTNLLPFDHGMRLDAAEGETTLWGRWHAGKLDDVRWQVDIPRMSLRQAGSEVGFTTNGLQSRGQWQRVESGWEAWLNTGVENDDGEPVANDGRGASGPALPRHWQASGNGGRWQVKADAFDIASLLRWRDRLALPEELDRWLTGLSPRGEVTGARVEHDGEEWRLQAALSQVAVDPWQSVPGGGPIDGWLEMRRNGGNVEFVGGEGMNLAFPQIFRTPLALQVAAGNVAWQRDDDRVLVQGDDLKARWRDAPVNGSFQLALGGSRPGDLLLALDFAEVDALNTPVVEWLPVQVMDEGLQEWLSLGAAGRVEQGRLRLQQPLKEDLDDEEIDLQLALDVTQGRLPFAAAWPMLENVEGHLSYADQRLHARVEHAESHGVTASEGRIELEDDTLSVTGALQGTTTQWLTYLADVPELGLDAEDWSSQGDLNGEIDLTLPIDDPDALDLEVLADIDIPELRYRPVELLAEAVDGELVYHHQAGSGDLVGSLEGRVFDGPIQASIDTADENTRIEGRARIHSILDRVGGGSMSTLASGEFPYMATVTLDDAGPRVQLESDLEGTTIDLPAPFGKQASDRVPLRFLADLQNHEWSAELEQRLRIRWRQASEGAQGQAWLERWPASPDWHNAEGWEMFWATPQLDVDAWTEALSTMDVQAPEGEGTSLDALRRIVLQTDCLSYDSRCLGSVEVEGSPSQSPDAWQATLSGSLANGDLHYRPWASDAVDIALSRLDLGALLPSAEESGDAFLGEVATAPTPTPFPKWIGDLPDGRLRVADIEHQGRRFGPLMARWRASPDDLRIEPLGLTLGKVSARGELIWEASGDDSSLTRSRLSLDGGDLGTALERLAQPVTIRNERTAVKSQLAWPGAPWQFGLERSRGNLDIELTDGHFLNIDAPSAKLIGLLNVDNLLRRLRLDFSDVAEQGTSFDSVKGAATLYGGKLETQGPVVIDGPATDFRLDGTVDLVRRELDQRLGVSVPVSQNLPLAAVAVGSPVLGGALFVAHQLFGGAIDRATQIHYRVRGPLTAPQISLERAE
ncbi:TIGR02099 family protein [Aidingimonas halophila]|uniref:TIGR02099 family protein n=2 Tax=Aidingimonas halophila TaxID=574349 RepID=A0A1H2R277_9GAMM|nr:TIGR02099 family protein [Aidingimonas halophila]